MILIISVLTVYAGWLLYRLWRQRRVTLAPSVQEYAPPKTIEPAKAEARLMDIIATKGIHVTYGAMSRRSLKVPNKFLIFKRIQLHGFWVTEWIKETDAQLVGDTYQQLAQWISEGKLTQPVDSIYPLAEIPTALKRAMEDQRDGKVLLDCNSG